MKIRRLEVTARSMTLAEPYAIAYEEVDRVDNVFVLLVTDSHIGIGCAAPDREVTGETAESVVAALSGIAEPMLRGEDGGRRSALLERLQPELAGQPAALAAVDLALHDLLGKACGQPVWRLLGGFRDRIETSVTIGILPAGQTVEAARRRVREGFRCLKLKGGRDVDDDIARVRAVRAAVGPAVELRFDANQGYSFESSVAFVEGTRAAQVELLEQPTVRGEADLLGRVTAEVEIPVMADESLMTLRDAFRLAGRDLVDMVNVKLMKVGGIDRALEINAVARSARMETMVGCMDESEAAIAGGLAVALARRNVAYADLDGHLDLTGDPAAGCLRLAGGVLFAPEAPGLGVELRD